MGGVSIYRQAGDDYLFYVHPVAREIARRASHTTNEGLLGGGNEDPTKPVVATTL